MPRERYGPTDPREWLNRAKGNLAIAGAVIPGSYYEDLSFEAQQAAAKAIKAIFIHRGVVFPYIHDLEKLLRLLASNGLKIPKYVDAAKELTDFAHVTRYPGAPDAVTARQFRRALRIARVVVNWAERQIAKPPSP